MNNIKNLLKSVALPGSLVEAVRDGYLAIFEEISVPDSIKGWLSSSVIQAPVYHATPKAFDKFDSDKSSTQNYIGKGIYFTDSPEDAAKNYGTKTSSDHDHRRNELKDILNSDFDSDELVGIMTEYYAKKYKSIPADKIIEVATKAAESIAAQTLNDKAIEKIVNTVYGDQYRTIPAFIKLENPVVLKKNGGTFWHFSDDMVQEPEYSPDEDDEDQLQDMIEHGYDPEYFDNYEAAYSAYFHETVIPDHAEDEYQRKRDANTSNDPATVFIEKIMDIVHEKFSDDDVRDSLAIMCDEIRDNEGGYVMDIFQAFRKSKVAGQEDDAGNIHATEYFNQVLRQMGYDGIVMEPDPNWGMDIEPGTLHYIVFDPKNIKSAITGQDLG